MRVNGFDALAVEWSAAGGAAEREADGDGTRNFGPPKKGGRLIDDLVEGDGGKIGELHLDDGPHALDGRADRHADHGVFGDRRIKDAPGKFVREIFGGFECAAERADILSIDENARVIAQGVRLGFANGFDVGQAHVNYAAKLKKSPL